MNTYTKTICYYCGKEVSRAGFALIGHYRMHVREGLCTEVNTRNAIEFECNPEFYEVTYNNKKKPVHDT